MTADRPTTRTNASPNRTSGRPTLTVFGLGVVFVLGVAVYCIWYFGYVEGQEFAPDSFARRRFTFFQIPILGWQISPIDRTDISNNLENYLVSSALVPVRKTSEPKLRWDLVVAERGQVPTARRLFNQGEARILCQYLDATDAKQEHIWLTWTKSHQEMAKVIWPMVAQIARQELYVFVPDLFLFAQNATDAKQLRRDLDQLLAEKYLAFGKTQQALGRHDLALELFAQALLHVPGHSEAVKLQAESLRSLGKVPAMVGRPAE